MTKRRLLAVLICGLFMAAGPLMGCGETDDPSQTNNENEDNGDNSDNDNGNDNNNNTNTNNDNGDECEFNTDCNGDDICDDGECVAPDPPEPEVCDLQDWFYGQIDDSDDPFDDYAGGVPSTDPLTTGQGLADIWAELDAAWDPSAEEPIDVEFNPAIEVEATIIATSFIGDRRIYLQDPDGAMYFFQTSDDGGVPVEPAVGQRVSFKAESANIFFGNPQIRGYSEWTVLNPDENDGPVPYIEIEGDDEISEDDHFYRNIRVAGWLGEHEDDSWECGEFGEICYRMYYGDEAQHTITFRSNSDYVGPGDCVTYLGPVTTYPGYYEDNAQPQLDAENHSWWFADDSGGLD